MKTKAKKIWHVVSMFPFWFSKHHFKPAYFYISIFCSLVIYALYDRVENEDLTYSDTLILGMLGFILGWVGVYSWNEKNKSNTPPDIKLPSKDNAP
jgi:hypothetical protein